MAYYHNSYDMEDCCEEIIAICPNASQLERSHPLPLNKYPFRSVDELLLHRQRQAEKFLNEHYN